MDGYSLYDNYLTKIKVSIKQSKNFNKNKLFYNLLASNLASKRQILDQLSGQISCQLTHNLSKSHDLLYQQRNSNQQSGQDN